MHLKFVLMETRYNPNQSISYSQPRAPGLPSNPLILLAGIATPHFNSGLRLYSAPSPVL